MSSTLTALLARHARTLGTAPAVIYRDRAVSYAELEAESRRVAQGLAELGGGRLIAAEAAVRARHSETGAILAHGASGELEFRVPSRMAEYFGDPAAMAAALTADGYVRSGDLGYTAANGNKVQKARLRHIAQAALDR